MRLKGPLSSATLVALGILVTAIAGITHVASLLALPWRSDTDAFARVAAVVPPGGRATIAPDRHGLPLMDPAMLTLACRYDLAAKPFRIALAPFGDSFVTLGFHSRHGVTYYGLTVQATDATAFDLVLNRKDERTAETGTETGPDQDAHRVVVTAPEPEGFVTLATPLDGMGTDGAQNRLGKAECRSDANTGG